MNTCSSQVGVRQEFRNLDRARPPLGQGLGSVVSWNDQVQAILVVHSESYLSSMHELTGIQTTT